MDEFLCCIDYNKNNEIITGSNYITYQTWDGYLSYFTDAEFINENFLVLNPYDKKRQKLECGVSDLQWLTTKDILVATDDGSLQLFEYNDSTKTFVDLFYKREHNDSINCISVDFKNEVVLTASQDSYIKLWDIKNELSIKTYRCHRNGVVAIDFSPFDSKLFVSCSLDNTALLWDMKNSKPAHKLCLNNQTCGFPSAVSWSNLDSNLFAIGSEYGMCSLFDIRNLDQQLNETKLHERIIRKLVINNKLIATCSEDTNVCVNTFDQTYQLKQVYMYTEHSDYVVDTLWNPNKDYELVSCSWDGFIKKHDLQSFL